MMMMIIATRSRNNTLGAGGDRRRFVRGGGRRRTRMTMIWKPSKRPCDGACRWRWVGIILAHPTKRHYQPPPPRQQLWTPPARRKRRKLRPAEKLRPPTPPPRARKKSVFAFPPTTTLEFIDDRSGTPPSMATCIGRRKKFARCSNGRFGGPMTMSCRCYYSALAWSWPTIGTRPMSSSNAKKATTIRPCCKTNTRHCSTFTTGSRRPWTRTTMRTTATPLYQHQQSRFGGWSNSFAPRWWRFETNTGADWCANGNPATTGPRRSGGWPRNLVGPRPRRNAWPDSWPTPMRGKWGL
mmetsp:Transcript_13316/g.29300  ORF Transcript_13316/g.29300 Transcript_13316/m.29300 type:complete len:296 (+) Transcript_13316:691-1578(+)